MGFVKQLGRKFVFPLMMGLKLDRLLRLRTQKTLLNVMYHGVVLQDSTYFSPRHITAQQFEKQLSYLKKNFNIITLSEAFSAMANKQKLNKKTISISFDDGYVNNLTTALPLLEKYEIPATFFIATLGLDKSQTPCLWTEYIAVLKYFYPNESVQLGEYIFKNGWETTKNLSLFDFLKNCPWEDRDMYMKMLKANYPLEEKLKTLPEEIWKLMSREELLLFAESKYVTIASHTHMHYNLGNIDIVKSQEELLQSKQLLEDCLGKKINSLAYPDGSYSSQIKNIAQELGYEQQLAVNYKSAEDFFDKRIMNRHGISSTTTFESNMLLLNKSFANKGIKI